MTNHLNLLSTVELIKKSRICAIALAVVWTAAAIAILASLYSAITGDFSAQTFIMALIAFAASIPTYRTKIKIDKIIHDRMLYEKRRI
ncbi:MAG: hypothetical protein JXQ90_09340 [Cyclobacteriaceae bacterium]